MRGAAGKRVPLSNAALLAVLIACLAAPPALAPSALARFDRPLPALDRYDELLAEVAR